MDIGIRQEKKLFLKSVFHLRGDYMTEFPVTAFELNDAEMQVILAEKQLKQETAWKAFFGIILNRELEEI